MSLRKNNAMINVQANAFGAIFNSGSLEIYSGSQPADPNSAVTGTLLCTIPLPNPAFAAAAGGTISKSGTWSATASATGTAGYCRVLSSDALKWMDLSITEAGGGGDAIINDDAVVNGNTATVTSCSITVRAL